jgi:hypothetical protein
VVNSSERNSQHQQRERICLTAQSKILFNVSFDILSSCRNGSFPKEASRET